MWLTGLINCPFQLSASTTNISGYRPSEIFYFYTPCTILCFRLYRWKSNNARIMNTNCETLAFHVAANQKAGEEPGRKFPSENITTIYNFCVTHSRSVHAHVCRYLSAPPRNASSTSVTWARFYFAICWVTFTPSDTAISRRVSTGCNAACIFKSSFSVTVNYLKEIWRSSDRTRNIEYRSLAEID